MNTNNGNAVLQSEADELAWYALRVLPQREELVRKTLIYRGYQAFTKLEKCFGRWTGGKRIEKEYVAAPGYVFLGTSRNPWHEVHTCHLIRSVVSMNGTPALLDGRKLAKFLEMDELSLPDYFRFFRRDPFKIGDTVRIDHPNFNGFELPVKDIRNHEVIFDLVLLNQTTELRIPLENCYKAA